MTLPADEEGYYHCYSKEAFHTSSGSSAHSCQDNVTADVKHLAVTKKESETVISAPYTAVKFIPRVLVTRKQDSSTPTPSDINRKDIAPSTSIDTEKK